MHELALARLMGVNLSIVKSMEQSRQLERIATALACDDFNELRKLAQSPGGFILDSVRRIVWPILLHTHHGCYVDEKGSEKDLADPIQITKDIDRSLYYYPRDISPHLKAQKQRELHSLIVEILWRNPRLKYYQGFHDICSCFLLVLGKKDAIPAAENVALFFIRDGMLDSFDPISKQLRLMSSIVQYEDAELTEHLDRCHIMPYYALSWILTWFSHDFERFDKVARLFDLFISSSPLMPVYVASSITLLRRHEFLQADPDLLHSLITHIPQDMDVDAIVEHAVKLEQRYPPLELQKRSGLWLHEESPVNTWDSDWGALDWDSVPDRIRVDRYLSHPVQKEEWEDEMLQKWMAERQQDLID
ncbi:rab-GTPase-TBC domain-containing protein [Fennellomyces sp. T-0311]|nr:rab-GTPase-TBC domain-containing protein [Fennellomyces sp. T-0311]